MIFPKSKNHGITISRSNSITSTNLLSFATATTPNFYKQDNTPIFKNYDDHENEHAIYDDDVAASTELTTSMTTHSYPKRGSMAYSVMDKIYRYATADDTQYLATPVQPSNSTTTNNDINIHEIEREVQETEIEDVPSRSVSILSNTRNQHVNSSSQSHSNNKKRFSLMSFYTYNTNPTPRSSSSIDSKPKSKVANNNINNHHTTSSSNNYSTVKDSSLNIIPKSVLKTKSSISAAKSNANNNKQKGRRMFGLFRKSVRAS